MPLPTSSSHPGGHSSLHSPAAGLRRFLACYTVNGVLLATSFSKCSFRFLSFRNASLLCSWSVNRADHFSLGSLPRPRTPLPGTAAPIHSASRVSLIVCLVAASPDAKAPTQRPARPDSLVLWARCVDCSRRGRRPGFSGSLLSVQCVCSCARDSARVFQGRAHLACVPVQVWV